MCLVHQYVSSLFSFRGLTVAIYISKEKKRQKLEDDHVFALWKLHGSRGKERQLQERDGAVVPGQGGSAGAEGTGWFQVIQRSADIVPVLRSAHVLWKHIPK